MPKLHKSHFQNFNKKSYFSFTIFRILEELHIPFSSGFCVAVGVGVGTKGKKKFLGIGETFQVAFCSRSLVCHRCFNNFFHLDVSSACCFFQNGRKFKSRYNMVAFLKIPIIIYNKQNSLKFACIKRHRRILFHLFLFNHLLLKSWIEFKGLFISKTYDRLKIQNFVKQSLLVINRSAPTLSWYKFLSVILTSF